MSNLSASTKKPLNKIIVVLNKHRYVLPVALIIASGTVRFYIFNRSGYAPGWDSYYYIMKAWSILEKGQVKCFELSLVYPLYTGLAMVIHNYVLAYKILIALLSAWFTFSVYYLISSWLKDYWLAIIAASITVYSFSLTYFAGQFPKNLLGINLLICSLAFLAKNKTLLGYGSLVLTIFIHRMTAVLSIAVMVLSGLRKLSLKWVITLSLLVLAGSFLLPGVIHYSDYERFHGVLVLPKTIAPFAFITAFGKEYIPTIWEIELYVLFGAAILFLFLTVINYVRTKSPLKIELALGLIILILIFPFLSIQTGSMGFRLFLGLLLIAVPCLVFFIKDTSKKIKIGISVLFIGLSYVSTNAYKNKDFDAPYGLYTAIAVETNEILGNLELPPKLVISHNGLSDILSMQIPFNSTNWPNEDPDIIDQQIWRISFNVLRTDYNQFLNPGDQQFIYNITPAYFLIREDVWNKFFIAVNQSGNDKLKQKIEAHNPVKNKPDFLKKGRNE